MAEADGVPPVEGCNGAPAASIPDGAGMNRRNHAFAFVPVAGVGEVEETAADGGAVAVAVVPAVAA